MPSAIDHPTNGLTLCKSHHWAMARDIIAPGPDLHGDVSKRLDPRRSNREKELHELAGKIGSPAERSGIPSGY